MKALRLRQAVVSATDRDAVVSEWQQWLGLGKGFADPGVGEFGLVNAVLPVGDAFLEVVSPKEAGAHSAAGRLMERRGGDCGYMAIFQVDAIDDARAHLQDCGFRTVWSGGNDVIQGTHVHPADIGGAIVSFDQAWPVAAWHWAGPDWTAQVATSVTSGLAGLTLAGADPDTLGQTWAKALNVELVDRTLRLPDHSVIRFVPLDDRSRLTDGVRSEGLVEILVWATDPSRAGEQRTIAGTTFTLVAKA